MVRHHIADHGGAELVAFVGGLETAVLVRERTEIRTERLISQ
jgi:hypothetical protein